MKTIIPAQVTSSLIRQTLSMGKGFFADVVSQSMFPVIYEGDKVLVCQVDSSQIKVGEIVMLEAGDALVTHRVIRIDGRNIVAKGDRNHIPDTPVDVDKVLGRIIAVQRKSGKVVDFRGKAVRYLFSTIGQISGWAGDLEVKKRAKPTLIRMVYVKFLRVLLDVQFCVSRLYFYFIGKKSGELLF